MYPKQQQKRLLLEELSYAFITLRELWPLSAIHATIKKKIRGAAQMNEMVCISVLSTRLDLVYYKV